MGFKLTPNINKIWIKENKNRIKINSYGFNDFEINNAKRNVLLTGRLNGRGITSSVRKQF